MPPLLSLFLTITFLLIPLILYSIITKTKPSNPKNLPPSPPSIPVLGHLHRLGCFAHIYRALQPLSTRYGPVMFLRLGCVPTVILSSASAVEQLIRTQDAAISSRPHSTVYDILIYGSTDVAFAPYGEYWRQARRICVLHLLSTKRVQSFRHIREQEVTLMIDKIRAGCAGGGTGSSVLNLSKLLVKLSNDIICSVALGQKKSPEEASYFINLMAEFAGHLGKTPIGEIVPWLGWLDWLSGIYRSARKTSRRIDCFLESVIEEHVKAKRDGVRDGEEEVEGSDLIDVLLNVQEEDDEISGLLSRDRIKAMILDMFAAGTNTVYSAIEWTMAELIKNPKEMKRVQEEVRNTIGATGKLTEDLTENMRYLKASIKEALRLHPPVPLLVPRESIKDVELLGYHIPARTRILINAWAIGRDPKNWDRAEEFRPERFLNSDVNYKGNNFELIPFGTGRRICPGIIFASATMELALAGLLHHFDWELPHGMNGESLDMAEEGTLTIRKKTGLVVVAKPTLG